MPISITINNKTFNIPGAGEDPGWGEDTTGWIEEISDVVNSLFGSGDIATSNVTIANNQTSAQNITGLAFNASTVRAAIIEYSIYRASTATPSGNAEGGFILLVYDNNAGSGNRWLMSRDYTGEAGVVINITDAGQLTYTSTDINAVGYSGTMTFKARTFAQ